jgi:hypothetical protein
MHLGHVWNAYCNWSVAVGVPGGEFVFVVDTLAMRVCNGWRCGYGTETAVPRYVEDLAWLGMPPDRIEWSRDKPGDPEYNAWRRERHRWAVEKLCGRYPKRIGRSIHSGAMTVGSPASQMGVIPAHPQGGVSGDIPKRWASASLAMDVARFNPFVTACCVVDDIDFRVHAWAAGRDLIAGWGWCLEAYRRLGYMERAITFHKLLKRVGHYDKESKTDPNTITVRQLRESGYTAKGILDTLCELSLRSEENGWETIAIPPGILEPGEVRTLEFRDRDAEETAAGRFDNEAPLTQEWKADIMSEAARQLCEEVGTVADV